MSCKDNLCECVNATGCSQSLDELTFQRGIWQAAIDGDVHRVKTLIHNGTDVNLKDSSGYSALHYAARNGKVEVLKYLIDAGACVNCCTKSGKETPLHRAAFTGRLDIVKLLVENGANLTAQNIDGQTCLHKCKINETAEYLLKLCPSLADIPDKKGIKFTLRQILDKV